MFSEVHDSGKVTKWRQQRRGWTEERPIHKIGGETGADMGGWGGGGRKEERGRREQEMPVCR